MCAVIAALCAFGGRQAYAEEDYGAELSPVEVSASEIAYHSFDMPTAVYADSKGVLVGGTNIEEVSSETEITSKKAVACDKLYRHLEHGDHLEYLIVLYNGVLSAHYGENDPTALSLDSYVVDFDVYNDTLYAVTNNALITVPLSDTGFAIDMIKTAALTSDRHSNISLQAVAVVSGDIFVAVRSAFWAKSDICYVDDDAALTTFLMQTDSVIRLSAYGEYLYALSRGSIVKYKSIGGGILTRQASTDGSQIVAIHAYGDYVYAVDALNALIKYTTDFQSTTVLLASSSSAVGFFNLPTGVAVKSSKLFVADAMNNRVAVYGQTVEYQALYNPVSVASDSAGTVYVAYDYNKVGVFTDGELSNAERTITDDKLGVIKQIAVDTDKTLYIIADGGLFEVKNGEIGATQISDDKFKAITLGVGRDELYALTDSDVMKLNRQTGELSSVMGVGSGAISVAVDLKGTIFVLYSDRITCELSGNIYQYPLLNGGETYSLGGQFAAMAICTVDNKFVSYGDIIIVDTYKHRVFRTDGSTLGVKLVDESYEVPDVAADNKLNRYDGLIRVALRDADVFSLPVETAPVYTITAGRKVIVPEYDTLDTKEFALILIDDIEHGKLVQGYVYRDILSEALPYTDPPSAVGTIYNAATPIYKWPSRNSVAAAGFTAVNRNTQFKMLDFVEAYRDDYGYVWYRVCLDGAFEGYVLGVNLSLMSYEPVFIRPAYNAEIISYKGSTYAPAYILDEDGNYLEISKLDTGTRVEVVGAFDSSEQYTQVKYLDAELGTLTCYVETVYIKYNGVNIVLIVAVVVIVVTVILASIIIVRTVRRKKNKIDDEE
ncbi:MAG: hypothetical protein HDT28_06585 [Clostridiales bacterium]|nr:hypothetical protein [Clostridiales bacterium]